jgi:hypothetical protein
MSSSFARGVARVAVAGFNFDNYCLTFARIGSGCCGWLFIDIWF